MSNPEIVKTPTFVESILKVTAREELELDLDSELAKENIETTKKSNLPWF